VNARSQRKGRPLEGRWVVNTRSPRQSRELDVLLEERQAHPVSYPCIDICPPLDTAPLDQALTEAAEGGFDWLVFTSANAVEAVEDRLRELGIPREGMVATRAAAVGPGTAAAVSEKLGIAPEMCPEEHRAEALAADLVARRARRVLVPQAERAREALVRVLRENDVEVEAVTAYRTVVGTGGADVPRLVSEGRVDAVVFASPSAVDNMAVRFEQEGGYWEDLKRVRIGCVGPVTADAARERGLDLRVLPLKYTLPDLVNALELFYRHNPKVGAPAW
jgi:uroporphyrinogen-III synthase